VFATLLYLSRAGNDPTHGEPALRNFFHAPSVSLSDNALDFAESARRPAAFADYMSDRANH
jgi:hypothetical protein